MSDFELVKGNRREADYGHYYEASVELEDRVVTGAYREPSGEFNTVYVLANGLLAGKDSMRAAAHVAAQEGFASFAIDYSAHNDPSGQALESNATDVAAAIDAIDEGMNRRAAGMSKGGRVLIRALAKTEETVEAATLVVPAGIEPMKLSWLSGAARLATTTPEVLGMVVTDPLEAFHIGGTCVRNAVLHPRAVYKEMGELKDGDEHELLRELKAQEDAPFLRLVYGSRDLLIRARGIKKVLTSLPTFDEVVTYPGGHIDFSRNSCSEIARQVFQRDREIFDNSGQRPTNTDLSVAA